jgi:hypothetical protein
MITPICWASCAGAEKPVVEVIAHLFVLGHKRVADDTIP